MMENSVILWGVVSACKHGLFCAIEDREVSRFPAWKRVSGQAMRQGFQCRR
jgi:hypothetical protein